MEFILNEQRWHESEIHFKMKKSLWNRIHFKMDIAIHFKMKKPF